MDILERKAPWWVTAALYFGLPAILAAYLLIIQGNAIAQIDLRLRMHTVSDRVVVALMEQTCLNTSVNPDQRSACVAALLTTVTPTIADPPPLQ
jgi:hypothetical protein